MDLLICQTDGRGQICDGRTAMFKALSLGPGDHAARRPSCRGPAKAGASTKY
jgi:hypothetical protein